MSLIKIGYFSLLVIGSCIGGIRYSTLSPAFKILAWSVFMILLTTITDYFFISRYHHNEPVLQIQCFEEYVFYSLVYYNLFKNEVIKKVIVISLIIIIVF